MKIGVPVLKFRNLKEIKVRVQTRSFCIIVCVYRFIGKIVRLTASFDAVINLRMVAVFHIIEH